MTGKIYSVGRMPAHGSVDILTQFTGNQQQIDSSQTYSVSYGRKPTATESPQPILKESIASNVHEFFKVYASQWSQETGGHSSMTIRKRHPAFKSIVGLGWDAVPHLLRALSDMPDFWFPALREITGADPVPDSDRGDYAAMRDAWMQWGLDRGILR